MAFEDVSQKLKYVKYTESKPGDVLAIGHFAEVEIDQTYQKPRYCILGEDDVTTVLNASGQLDKIMGRLKLGDYVRIVFEGSSIMEKGKFKGKSAYTFKVQVDPEKRKYDMRQQEKSPETMELCAIPF